MERIDQIGLPRARHQMRLEIERRYGPIEMPAIELTHPAGQRGGRRERGRALEEPLPAEYAAEGVTRE